MKTIKHTLSKGFLMTFLGILILFTTTTCELFEMGLGDKVDIEPPSLEITSHSNGDYVKGIVRLSGTAIDDLAIASVKVSVAGTAAQDVEEIKNSGTWSIDISTTAFTDGEKEIVVLAADEAGKSQEKRILLFFDNKPPTVLLTSPDSLGEVNRQFGVIQVKGEAADRTRIRSVILEIYKNQTNELIKKETFSGTTNFTYSFDTTEVSDDLYYFNIIASDFAGNINSYFYHIADLWTLEGDASNITVEDLDRIDNSAAIVKSVNSEILIDLRKSTNPNDKRLLLNIDQAYDRPYIELSNLQYEGTISSNVLGANPRIIGRISDDDGVRTSSLEIALSSDGGATWSEWMQVNGIAAGDARAVDWFHDLGSSGANLDQGVHLFKLRVYDINFDQDKGYSLDNFSWGWLNAGGPNRNKDGEGIVFVIDFGPPNLSLNSPAAGSIHNQDITVQGTSSDPNGVQKIELFIGQDLVDSFVIPYEEKSAEEIDFNLTVPVGTESGKNGNGTYNLKVRSTDFTNASFDIDRQVIIDITPPVVTFLEPSVDSIVKGKTVTIRGESSDNVAVSKVYLWQGPSSTAPGPVSSWGLDSILEGTYVWSKIIDTTVEYQAPYSIWVAAEDTAGNVSQPSELTLQVDQERDRPLIELTNMEPTGTYQENALLTASGSITGTVEDDDRVKAGSVEINISSDGGNTWSGWTAVSKQSANDSTLLSWSHDVSALSQGAHLFTMRVRDTKFTGDLLLEDFPVENYNWGWTGAGGSNLYKEGVSPNTPNLNGIPFMIDHGPPLLSITAPENNSIKKETFTISGTAQDANGISKIEVKIPGQIENYTDITGLQSGSIIPPNNGIGGVYSWSFGFTVEPGGATDGDWKYYIKALDGSGASTEQERLVRVDATPPAVSFIYPAEEQELNETLVIRGTSADNRQIGSVLLYITSAGSDPSQDDADWILPEGTYSWNYSWNTKLHPQGEYTLHLKAYDLAGNQSPVATLPVTINQESDRPEISLTNLATGGDFKENLFESNPRILGIITDDDGVRVNTIEIRTRKAINHFTGEWQDWSSWSPVTTRPAANTTNAEWSHNLTSLGQGFFQFELRVQDINFTGDIQNPAADNYNWNSLDPVYFAVDTAPPVVTITSPSQNGYYKTDFTLRGNAEDTNGLALWDHDGNILTAQVSYVEVSTDGELTWTRVAVDENGDWNYLVTDLWDGSAEGAKNYKIKSTDYFENSTTETFIFTVDTQGPEVAITSPGDGDWLTGSSYAAGGSAEDSTSLVSAVYWSLDEGTTWNTASGTSQWTAGLNLDSLPEGELSLTVKAVDAAGNESTSVTRAFGNDKNPPSITEERVGTGGVYRNSSFSLGDGFLTDTNGITHLLVVQNRIGVSIDTIVDDSGLSGKSIPLVLENLPRNPAATSELLLENGVYEYTITVFDVAGKQASLTRTVTVDTTSPTVEFTSIAPVVGGNEVNGEITFSVSAIDENGLSGVKYWILPSPSLEPDYDAPLGTDFAGPPYRLTLDTKTLLTDNTSYDIWAVARDRAGNVGVESYNFLVNQESDRPEISLTNMTVEGDYKDNLLESNPRIIGLITDDDGVQVETIKIRTRKALDPYSDQWSAWSDWAIVSTRPTTNTTSANWSHNLSSLGQGFFQFELKVLDIKYSGDPDNPESADYNWNSLGPVNFAVDTAFPVITFTSPSQNSFQKGTFTLSGTVSDTNGLDLWDHDEDSGTDPVAYVDLRRDEEETWERISVSGGIWNYSVSSLWDGSMEGARVISVKGADYFGKETITDFNFTVDTVAPTIPVISSPQPADWLSGTTGTATGTSADAGGSGVNLVEWSTDGINWNPAVGTGSWNLSLNLTALGEGTKTLYVRATDRAGNVGTGAALGISGFGIDQSNPEAFETAFGAPTGLRSQIFSLEVEAEDTNNLSEIVVTQEKIGDAEGEVEIFRESVSGKIVERSITSLPRKPEEPEISLLADGRYLYKIMVTDVAGKPTSQTLQREVTVDLTGPEVTIASPVPGQKISGTAFTISGSVTDFENVSPISEVRYWVGTLGEDPPLSVLDWLQATGGASFSATVNLELLGEGDKTLYVLARDGAGNWSGTTLSPKEADFMVDQSAPTLSGFSFSEEVVLVNGINYAREGFTLEVTAGDSNRISTVTLVETRNNGTPQDVTWASGNTGEQSRILTSPLLPLDGVSDGIYEYKITVTDAADKSTQIIQTVTVDIAPPAVEITSINPTVGTNLVNGIVTITASGIDANGLQGLKWWILPQGAEDPEYATEGGISFGEAPFTVTKDTTDGTLPDGQYLLWVIGKDRAGNETRVSRSIQVDQTSDLPQAGFTDLDPAVGTEEEASDNLLETNPRIRGTLSDDDSVDAASIRIALNQSGDPSGWEWLTVTPTGSSGREVGFEYSLSSLEEGTHWFSLEFSDLASAKNGKVAVTETVGPVYFVIDKNVPTVTVTSPAAGAVKNNDFLIEGTAWDANGLKRWDDDGDPLTDQVPYVEVSTDNGTTWEKVAVDEADDTWSYSVIGLWDGDHEGTKNYRIRATDIFSKEGEAVPVYSFKVDTLGPTVIIGTPISNSWLTVSSYPASGTANDATSSVEWIYFSTDNGSSWDLANGKTQWTATLDLQSLDEGSVTLLVKAVDIAGNEGPEISRSFGNDQDLPYLEEEEVGTGTIYRKASFNLGGTLTDSNSIKRLVVVQKSSAGTVTIHDDATLSGESSGFSVTDLPRNHSAPSELLLANGVYEYNLTLYDIAGNPFSLTRTVTVDTTPPTVEYTSINPLVGESLVNGEVTFSVAASDENGLSGVKYWILDSGAEAPDYDLGGTSYGQPPYSLMVDTTAPPLVDGNSYTLWTLARDRAQNDTVISFTLEVDQSSDKPRITPTNLVLEGPNTLGRDPLILFNVEDDDEVTASLIQYSLDAGTTWNNLSPQITTNSRLIQARTTLAGIPQGTGTIRFRALDKYSGGVWEDIYGDPGNNHWAETVDIPFIVDYGPPAVTLSAPIASTVWRTNIPLSGSAQDYNGISKVEATLGGVTWSSENVDEIVIVEGENAYDPVSFSFSIPVNLFLDGDYNLQVVVTDNSSSITTQDRPLGIDRTPPENTFTQPAEGATVNGSITVKGEVSDNRRIANTYLWHGEASLTPPVLTDPSWVDLGTNLLWSKEISTASVAPTGNYKVVVVMVDSTGNQSDPFVLNLLVDQTQDRPEIDLTNLTEGALASENALGRNARILGTVEDDDGIAFGSIQIKIDAGDWGAVTYQPAGTGTLISWYHDISALPQGPHTVTVRAWDTNNLDDSVFEDSDNYGWGITSQVNFFIDYGPPVLDISGPPNGAIKNNSFDISGTAQDPNGVTSVEISIKGGAFVGVNTENDFANWDYTILVEGDGSTDGVYSYQIKATDASGAVTTLDRQFVIDATPPGVTINTPAINAQVNGKIFISGNATDGYQLSNIYYYIAPNGIAAPEFPGELWTALNQQYAWQFEFDTASKTGEVFDYPDGIYTIHLKALDAAGNSPSPATTRNFSILQSSDRPQISVTTLKEAGTALENLLPNTLKITGTAEDDDNVDYQSLQIRTASWDGSSWSTWTDYGDITEPPLSNNRVVVWTHEFTGFTDGTYKYQMRVADENDRNELDELTWGEFSSVESAEILFSVDTAAPEGDVNSPLQGEYIPSAVVNIQGVASDSSGIKHVKLKFGSDPTLFTTLTEDDFENWNYEYTASGDGTVTFQVIITDIHNKVTTLDRYFTVDTEAPSASFTLPAPDSIVDGSLLIRGEADDNYLVKEVWFSLRGPTDPVPLYPGNYEKLSGTFSWSKRIRTSDYDDGAYTVYIVTVDNAGNDNSDAPATLLVNFDQDQNIPQISLSNVPDNPTQFGLGGALLGTILDYDKVDVSTIGVIIDGGEPVPLSNPLTSDSVSVTFTHSLAALADRQAPYSIQIVAYDVGEDFGDVNQNVAPEMGLSDIYYITIDRENPTAFFTTLDIDDPYSEGKRLGVPAVPNVLINDGFTLYGTARDDSGIKSVMVSTNGGTSWADASYNAGDETWSIPIPITRTPASDGNMTISVEVKDNFDKPTLISLPVVIDTTEPVIGYFEPEAAATVNGDVVVRGTVTEAGDISSFTMTLGKRNKTLDNTGNNRSFYAEFDSYEYNNDLDADFLEDNRWSITININAEDAAGNLGTGNRTITIDTDTDKPNLSIATPDDEASVAGTILVQGIAQDDDAPDYVELYVNLNDDEAYNYQMDLDGDDLFESEFEDETVPRIVDVVNGVWSTEINENNELSGAGLTWIRLLVVPVDINGIKGDGVERRIYIDATAPGIINVNYSSGALVKGEVTLTGTITDDSPLLASRMRISTDGGSSYQVLNTTYQEKIGNLETYSFTHTINTAGAGFFPDSSGIIYTIVQVTDGTFKQANLNINFNVDNKRPEGIWNHNLSLPYVGTPPNETYTYLGNATIPDSSYTVLGNAKDGTGSGIEKINVYFVKDVGGSLRFYSPSLSEPDNWTAVTYGDLYNQDGTLDEDVPFTEDSDFIISINNRLERAQFDQVDGIGDKDGFQEYLQTGTLQDEWYAFFDTTLFPDGPIDICYVVYDRAGNTSYGKAPAQIANNPPSISSFVLNGETKNSPTITYKAGGLLDVRINATDAEGLNTDTYKLTVLKKYDLGLNNTIGDEEAFTSFYYGTGGVENFDIRTGGTSGYAEILDLDLLYAGFEDGKWYLFQAEVRDTDGNLTTRDFYLLLNNADSLVPTAEIDPFTQGSVSGLLGHLEEAGAKPGLDAKADLSGTVRVTGTAYDDTAVASVTLEISFDGGATWYTLGNATLGSPTGNAEDGYTYSWFYVWNTATITDGVTSFVAKEDIKIRVYATDTKPGTPNVTPPDSRQGLTVDVVPYITDITTGFDSGFSRYMKRSALGEYSLAAHPTNTFLIKGYNLNPATGTSGDVTIGVADADVISVNGTYTEVTVSRNLTAGGALTVYTNTVESQNNTNDDTLPQNRELSSFSPDLNDNRSIALWSFNSRTGLTGKTDAVMRTNADSSAAEWLYTEGGTRLMFTNGGTPAYMTHGFALEGGDFAFNDNGTLLWLFLHNAKWTTQTAWGWHGSVQWGRGVTGTESENNAAYNWNLPNTARLGVGNMSFINDANFAFNNAFLSRYKDLRLVTSGGDGDTTNLVAYRDVSSSSSAGIVFYGFSTGTGVTQTTNLGGTPIWYADLSKTVNRTQAYQGTGTDTQKQTGVKTPADHRGYITTDNASHFDIGIIPADVPDIGGIAIAVWHGSDGNLWLAANPSPVTDATFWETRPTPVAENAGSHVVMKIDPEGGVHLAYLDSELAYLRYTYLPTFNANDSEKKTVLVDARFSSGQYNGIAIRNFGTEAAPDYRPVISTFSTTYAGTRAAIRVAWPVTNLAGLTDGADMDTSEYSGSWEVMLVPAVTTPQSAKSFIEITNPTGANQLVVGYNGTYLEEATYLGTP